ncbi:MAG: putative toxin-antitoxin system toxin component, PIN family [Petrimonas sp.]|nr:putative toxin-antitoxin system toxin component, PIN family [Petrimonas sp.]
MRKNKQYRVIIDTNIWISFLISNQFEILDKLFVNNNFILLFSAELIDELGATIQKPKLRKYFREEQALEDILSVFDAYIDFVDVKSRINVCRDFNDNFLLSLAKDGKADFLLTGDKDLLELNPFEKTQIITIAEFIEKQ